MWRRYPASAKCVCEYPALKMFMEALWLEYTGILGDCR